MKKHFIFFVALFFTAQMSMAASVTAPADIPAYWASVDGKSGATLWSAVSAATGKNFKSIGYNGLYSAYLKTDVYPADSVGKAGKIWDMYGECVFASTNTCGNYNGVCDCYNREHSIPQSWWGEVQAVSETISFMSYLPTVRLTAYVRTMSTAR